MAFESYFPMWNEPYALRQTTLACNDTWPVWCQNWNPQQLSHKAEVLIIYTTRPHNTCPILFKSHLIQCSDIQTGVHSGPVTLSGPLLWSIIILLYATHTKIVSSLWLPPRRMEIVCCRTCDVAFSSLALQQSSVSVDILAASSAARGLAQHC